VTFVAKSRFWRRKSPAGWIAPWKAAASRWQVTTCAAAIVRKVLSRVAGLLSPDFRSKTRFLAT
jgi:hypothetical protein